MITTNFQNGVFKVKTKIIISILLMLLSFFGCSKNKSTEPTESNQPPSAPSNPTPNNGASDQPLSITLTWQCSDPEADSLLYDVYFGTTQNPSIASSNQTETSYQPSGLQYNSTYYWKIIAKDSNNHETSGLVWSFSTSILESGLHIIGHYNAPGIAGKVIVNQDHAYIIYNPGRGDAGLLIIDISDPTNPVFTADLSYSLARDLSIIQDDLYLVGGYYLGSDGFLSVIDVADPTNPQETEIHTGRNTTTVVANNEFVFTRADSLRKYTRGYHLSQIDSKPISFGDQLFLSDYLYTITATDFFILSHDFESIGQLQLNGISPEEIAVEGNFAYLAGGDQGIRIISITNPQQPSFISGYVLPDDALGIAVYNGYGFVPTKAAGLYVLDVSDVHHPTSIASYQTADEALGVYYSNSYIYLVTGSYPDNGDFYILQFVP